MKTISTFTKFGILMFFAYICIQQPVYSYSLKHYTVQNGLLNNTINTIYQDHSGFMLFSTANGINFFDGLKIQKFHPVDNPDFLVGHTIDTMFEAQDNIFWFLTDKGLIKYDNRDQTSHYFKEFDLGSHIAKGPDNEVYLVNEEGSICYYNKKTNTFDKTSVGDIRAENIVNIFIDYSNTLWIISEDNSHKSFSIRRKGNDVKLTPSTQFRHKNQILWCYQGEKELLFVDETLTFFEYNIPEKIKHHIFDLTDIIVNHGEITSIIKDRGDYFLGSSDGGLFKIKSTPDQKTKYQISRTSIRNGIISMKKDKYQDILWIGTSGEGVFMYFNEPTSIENILSSKLSYPVTTPINALFVDKTQTLRIGTAGNGIISIYDFEPDNPAGSRSELYSISNTSLSSLIVSAFASSTRNLFWIGTENGVNYFSYNEHRVKNLPIFIDEKPIRQIISICEINDSTLYIVSKTDGMIKIQFKEEDEIFEVTSVKPILIPGMPSEERITVAYKENKSTIWIGTNTKGAYKLDCNADRAENALLHQEAPLNKINAILKTDKGHWFGTDNGLIFLGANEKKIYNQENGFPYKNVYAIQEDSNGDLWVSTNQGLGQFSMEKQAFFPYQQQENNKITKFIANSSFKDYGTSTLLLGGENGFSIVKNNDYKQQNFTPHIIFNNLSVLGEEKNIFAFLTSENRKPKITVEYNQSVLSIPFVAVDFINGENYTYYYKLDEQGDHWINNDNSNVAFFTYLPSGKYTLSAKYYNKVNGNESQVYPIVIHVLPPWYKTWWAYLIYISVIIILLYTGYQIVVKQTQKKITKTA